MILAGIDEAGYGPILGPLVVGCCVFEVNDDGDDPPCLWKKLRRVVSKSRSKTGQKIHVNDSKLVYSPAGGLKGLERSVMALAAAAGVGADDLPGFLQQVGPGTWAQLSEYPWYAAYEGEKFPIEQDALSIRLLGNSIRAEMERCQTRCAHLAAKVMGERELNRLLERTRNKSSVLFSMAAGHLDHLLRQFAARRLVIVCDRQGGREHYGHLLRLMFEDWALQVTAEGDGHSEYRLSRGGLTVRLMFCEKAETQCLPVAVASMLSKYLREALMRRFNAYWCKSLPGLEPTAGYYTDGLRFLKDIEAKRREMGVADAEMVRAR